MTNMINSAYTFLVFIIFNYYWQHKKIFLVIQKIKLGNKKEHLNFQSQSVPFSSLFNAAMYFPQHHCFFSICLTASTA